MRTIGRLVFCLMFLGVLTVRPTLAYSTYQQYQGGYDPHAMMAKWQGSVLNISEQTNMRPSSDNQLMYGNGTREYPTGSYMYPPQQQQQYQQYQQQPQQQFQQQRQQQFQQQQPYNYQYQGQVMPYPPQSQYMPQRGCICNR